MLSELLIAFGQRDLWEQFTSSLPPSVRVVYYYLLDGQLWLFGCVALIGTIMFIVSMRKVAVLSRREFNFTGFRQGFPERVNPIRAREPARAVEPLTLAPRLGFAQKIVGSFAGAILILGLLVTVAVYYLVNNALRDQAHQRMLTMATNLSDAAVVRVLAKDRAQLKALLMKYAQFGIVAYAVVQDRKGKILAHTFPAIPAEVQESMTNDDLRVIRNKTNVYRGREVYEARVPLLNGEHGAVHLGIWQSAVHDEVRQSLQTIIGLILATLFAVVTAAILLARKITEPVLKISRAAARISQGELDSPVGVASKDEVGEIAYSLERMRSSLKAVMMRLERN